MIRLQRISTADGFLYEYMEQLITAAFPPEEHRPLEELRLYTDSRPHFYDSIIFHHDTPVGFITYWDFAKFYYVEHFAVDPAQRNGGHGKNVLNHLCQLLQHDLLHFSLNVFDAAHVVPAGAMHDGPAKVRGTILGGAAAAGKILGILLVHILPALVAVVTLGHKFLAHGGVYL